MIDVDIMIWSLPSRNLANGRKLKVNTLRQVLGRKYKKVVKEGFLDLVGFGQLKKRMHEIRDERGQGAQKGAEVQGSAV